VTPLIFDNHAYPIYWSARAIRMDDIVQRTDVDDLIWINNRDGRRRVSLSRYGLTHYADSAFASTRGHAGMGVTES
jgi:hypothetical protein